LRVSGFRSSTLSQTRETPIRPCAMIAIITPLWTKSNRALGWMWSAGAQL